MRFASIASSMVLATGVLFAQQPPPAATRSLTLPVVVIRTAWALEDERPTYAASVKVDAPSNLHLGAYGAGGLVWLGPASWTGSASSGVDGTIVVNLFPKGGSPSSSHRVTYRFVPACVGCMLSGAAPFFPDAMKAWDREFNADGKNPVKVPAGLEVEPIGPTLARYTLPDRDLMKATGAAFYDQSDDGLFAIVLVQLPPTDSALAAFLVRHFGESIASLPR